MNTYTHHPRKQLDMLRSGDQLTNWMIQQPSLNQRPHHLAGSFAAFRPFRAFSSCSRRRQGGRGSLHRQAAYAVLHGHLPGDCCAGSCDWTRPNANGTCGLRPPIAAGVATTRGTHGTPGLLLFFSLSTGSLPMHVMAGSYSLDNSRARDLLTMVCRAAAAASHGQTAPDPRLDVDLAAHTLCLGVVPLGDSFYSFLKYLFPFSLGESYRCHRVRRLGVHRRRVSLSTPLPPPPSPPPAAGRPEECPHDGLSHSPQKFQ